MKHKHRIASYIFFSLIIILFVYVFRKIPALEQFTNPLLVRDFLQGWGIYGYLIFIILLFLSIILPIPSTPVVLGGGYVYGTAVGTILAMIGTILGGVASFYLVRLLGEPFLEKLVDKHHIIHFNHLFKKYETKAALISYAIPIFPSDVVSYLLGLTPIKIWTFLFLVTIGTIPRNLIINALGSDLAVGFTWSSGLILLFSAAFLLIALFREKIKLMLFKDLRYLQAETSKEAKKAEHFIKKEIKAEEKKLRLKRETKIKR